LTRRKIRSNFHIAVRTLRISTLTSTRTLLAVVLLSGLRAQTPEPRPAFEVVSIKPLDGIPRMGPNSVDGGYVNYPTVRLRALIAQAYDIAVYQIDGPPWLNEMKFYRFSAKLPDGASGKQINAMLQTALADKFALKVHWESRVQPVFALLVDKGGAKLKKSDESTAERGPDGTPLGFIGGDPRAGHFAFRNYSIANLALYLSAQVGQPVLDMTEIQGRFDLQFDASFAGLAAMRQKSTENLPADDSESGSIFTAMKTLGLKLESRKAPIQHLIVDSALQLPTEN